MRRLIPCSSVKGRANLGSNSLRLRVYANRWSNAIAPAPRAEEFKGSGSPSHGRCACWRKGMSKVDADRRSDARCRKVLRRQRRNARQPSKGREATIRGAGLDDQDDARHRLVVEAVFGGPDPPRSRPGLYPMTLESRSITPRCDRPDHRRLMRMRRRPASGGFGAAPRSCTTVFTKRAMRARLGPRTPVGVFRRQEA